MPKRAKETEPAFGTDSFLDVTANLVGVLIVFIVLVGMRVRKTPTDAMAMDDVTADRLRSLEAGIDELAAVRATLERELEQVRQSVAVRRDVLQDIQATDAALDDESQAVQQDFQKERATLLETELELAEAQEQLVTLSRETAAIANVAAVNTRKFEHRSPIARPVDSEELHFELLGNRITFVDVAGLMERVRAKCRLMESEIRSRSRVTAESTAVGPFRLRFTIARGDLPFSQSMFYTRDSLRAELVDWQVIPVSDERGELVAAALEAGSHLDQLLERYSPNKYALTLWTYSDSFTSFRQLRDRLSDRGYVVAARPLPVGIPIRGSVLGSRSMAQ